MKALAQVKFDDKGLIPAIAQDFETGEVLMFAWMNQEYIVDGDSVSLQMRLTGIDTPEITQTCEKTQHQTIDCGQLSKRYLQRLLREMPGVCQYL
jgi:endonuclease YncB( thermonuclease family)